MMNFRKIILLLIGLSIGFTTESYAGRSKRALGNEDSQVRQSVKKVRPVKARRVQRKKIEGINKRAARSSINRKKKQETVARTKQVRNTQGRSKRAASRKAPSRAAVHKRTAVNRAEKEQPKVAAPQKKAVVSQPEREKPAVPAPSLIVPEQNGQWRADYHLNNGTVLKRTQDTIQWCGITTRSLRINGLSLSMDQNQNDFLKELEKVGGVKKVTPLN